MSDETQSAASASEPIMTALYELIEALDRRVPHVERAGEVRLAREAADLRRAAVTRIVELTTAEPDRQRERERSGAVMDDDGGSRPQG